ncbi:MAG: DUF4302 domain-containing protein [Puia sp.]|nr:DUF4302 domain-containing protein [Puia sp.]
MSKIASSLVIASLVLAGCQKKVSDLIDGQTADQRLSAALVAYQNVLTQAPQGWILIEHTTGSAINQGATTTGQQAVFAYYVQFNDSNQVVMFSDFDSSMAAAPNTSSYRIKAVQRPALIFDTYSYIHVPCDPDPLISKSPFGPGLGWGADFEFSFADNVDPTKLGDTINLIGNLNSSNAVLIKATQAQREAYFNGSFAQSFVFDKIQNYFKHAFIGGQEIEFTPGVHSKVVDVNWLQSGALKSASTVYYLTGGSINFVNPVSTGTQTIASLDNIVWNASNSTASISVNGTGSTLAGSITPLKNDASAATRWRNSALSAQSLWVSYNGFHVDGVDDAFGMANLQYNGVPFYAYIYYPGVFTGGYDLLSPFFANTATGTYPDYVTETYLQNIGGLGYFELAPLATTPAPVTETNNLVSDPNGFYFVLKEDGSSYDMVSALDAKSWIDWQAYN